MLSSLLTTHNICNQRVQKRATFRVIKAVEEARSSHDGMRSRVER